MAHDQETYRRGIAAALLGFAIQLVLAVAVMIAAFWIESTKWQAGAAVLFEATWYLFGGLAIWIILLFTYVEHRRELAESLESEQLAKAAQTAGIFDEFGDSLEAAKRRVRNVYKWGVNGVGVFLAVFLIVIGLVTLLGANALRESGTIKAAMPDAVNTTVLIVLAAAAAFVAFIVARYISGMTKVKEWQMLRGGAGYLMGNTLVAALLLVGAIWAQFDNPLLFAYASLIVPVFMITLGIEIILSFLMGFYRPRKPGEIPRAAFDSRLLGWMTSPESLGKIISETINYQFGFEVSKSWFYQLLARSFTWLVIFGALTLIMFSSIVIVGPQQQAIVTTFGRITGEPGQQVLDPGIYFKWPWPISSAHTYSTGQVMELTVGSIAGEVDQKTIGLWSVKHGEEEYLITAPSAAVESGGGAKPAEAAGMALVGARIVIKYRVNDLLAYFKSADEPVELLTALAERQVNRYFVNHDIDMLIARGRVDAGGVLQARIQQDADSHNLGVDILFVGLSSMHPPADDVAKAFHEQIGALQERESKIEQARQEATEIYTKVVGSNQVAENVVQAIDELNVLNNQIQKLESHDSANQTALQKAQAERRDKERQIVSLISGSPGKAAEQIYAARADRWQRVNSERAKVLRFAAEYAAYQHAPKYYATKLYLEALERGMGDTRKYIITAEQAVPPVFDFDLKDYDPTTGALPAGQ